MPYPEVPRAGGQRGLDTNLLRRKVIKSKYHWLVNFMIVICNCRCNNNSSRSITDEIISFCYLTPSFLGCSFLRREGGQFPLLGGKNRSIYKAMQPVLAAGGEFHRNEEKSPLKN